jgi:YD repeat-containing protein
LLFDGAGCRAAGAGRVRTVTSDGVTLTTDYDALDRPTRVTYPDGTYEATTYDRLDVATTRDRLRRVTRYTHDALRRLVATRDPAGRLVQQRWAGGALATLIDANAHATTWQRRLHRASHAHRLGARISAASRLRRGARAVGQRGPDCLSAGRR